MLTSQLQLICMNVILMYSVDSPIWQIRKNFLFFHKFLGKLYQIQKSYITLKALKITLKALLNWENLHTSSELQIKFSLRQVAQIVVGLLQLQASTCLPPNMLSRLEFPHQQCPRAADSDGVRCRLQNQTEPKPTSMACYLESQSAQYSTER